MKKEEKYIEREREWGMGKCMSCKLLPRTHIFQVPRLISFCKEGRKKMKEGCEKGRQGVSE